MKKGFNTYLLLTIGIVILINIMSTKIFSRLDFTQDNRYTLSEATKNILKDIDSPVTITAYFSDKMPSQIKNVKQDFENILEEYASLSNGNVVYEFIDPSSDPKLEQEVMQQRVMPQNINVREKDKVTVQKIYMGVVIKKEENSSVIPFIRVGTSMEYDLTTSIKKISLVNKETIGFVDGFGSPELSKYSQVLQELSILYNVEPVKLQDTTNLSKYKTLVINSPKDSLPAFFYSKLDGFLGSGKNIMIGFDRVLGDLQSQTGSLSKTGLENWLKGKGLEIENSFAIDASCVNIQIQQKQGFMTMMSQKEFPYIPILKKFSKHPITKGIENVLFEYASPMRYVGDNTIKYTSLLETSDRSASMPCPTNFNVQRNWNINEFNQKNITVGAALEGKLADGIDSKLVVFSDGDFSVSGESRKQPDNINLMVNSIDWLSDDTGLIELRTKSITSRPIESIEEFKRALLKYLNLLLPILLIIGFGVYNSINNNIKRTKRMGGEYV